MEEKTPEQIIEAEEEEEEGDVTNHRTTVLRVMLSLVFLGCLLLGRGFDHVIVYTANSLPKSNTHSATAAALSHPSSPPPVSATTTVVVNASDPNVKVEHGVVFVRSKKGNWVFGDQNEVILRHPTPLPLPTTPWVPLAARELHVCRSFVYPTRGRWLPVNEGQNCAHHPEYIDWTYRNAHTLSSSSSSSSFASSSRAMKTTAGLELEEAALLYNTTYEGVQDLLLPPSFANAPSLPLLTCTGNMSQLLAMGSKRSVFSELRFDPVTGAASDVYFDKSTIDQVEELLASPASLQVIRQKVDQILPLFSASDTPSMQQLTAVMVLGQRDTLTDHRFDHGNGPLRGGVFQPDNSSPLFSSTDGTLLEGEGSGQGCHLHIYSQAEALHCLANKYILWSGDSTMQELAYELNQFLAGAQLVEPVLFKYGLGSAVKECGNVESQWRIMSSYSLPGEPLQQYNVTWSFVWNASVLNCDNNEGLNAWTSRAFVRRMRRAACGPLTRDAVAFDHNGDHKITPTTTPIPSPPTTTTTSSPATSTSISTPTVEPEGPVTGADLFANVCDDITGGLDRPPGSRGQADILLFNSGLHDLGGGTSPPQYEQRLRRAMPILSRLAKRKFMLTTSPWKYRNGDANPNVEPFIDAVNTIASRVTSPFNFTMIDTHTIQRQRPGPTRSGVLSDHHHCSRVFVKKPRTKWCHMSVQAVLNSVCNTHDNT